MTRLVWLVLHDGRSVIARDETEHGNLVNAMAGSERVLELHSVEGVEEIPAAAVRDFVLFDARRPIPAAAAIHRLVSI